MARIELRHTTIRIRDGLDGSATISTATPDANDTTVNIAKPVLNTEVTDRVPVGARFTVNTANNVTTYVVTGRTPPDDGPTATIEFAPAWGAVGTPAENDVITFLPQQIDVKIGEGNLSWTESKEYEYLLDRGDLDTVREMDEQPLDIDLEFVYEAVTTGTGEAITPVDAVKGIGGAAEWVSSSEDPCEPYCVELEVLHLVPCGPVEDERLTFPDFRYEGLDYDLSEATISVSGRCNVSDAVVERGDFA